MFFSSVISFMLCRYSNKQCDVIVKNDSSMQHKTYDRCLGLVADFFLSSEICFAVHIVIENINSEPA
jgi:hypothetical protein